MVKILLDWLLQRIKQKLPQIIYLLIEDLLDDGTINNDYRHNSEPVTNSDGNGSSKRVSKRKK